MSTEFATFATYNAFLASEGVPVIEEFYVKDPSKLELGPSNRRGGLGAYINLQYQRLFNLYLAEIPQRGSLNPERHLFEEFTFVIKGQGHTLFRNGDQSYDLKWKTGSFFAIPTNELHEHINDDPDKPARLLFYSSAPLIFNLIGDFDTIFNTEQIPKTRLPHVAMSNAGGVTGRRNGLPIYEADFVPDIYELCGKLGQWYEDDHSQDTIHIKLPSTLRCHLKIFPSGTYGVAHQHGPGAHIYWLSGEGYSLLWKEGIPKKKVTWRKGSLLSPPGGWYHQHFNTSKEPAYHVAFKEPRIRFSGFGHPKTGEPVAIKRKDEEPVIKRDFLKELKKKGVKYQPSNLQG